MSVEHIIIFGLGVAFICLLGFYWYQRRLLMDTLRANAELIRISEQISENYDELSEAHRGYRESTRRQEQNYLDLLDLYGHDTSNLRRNVSQIVERKLPDGTTYHIIEDEEETHEQQT